MVECSAGALLYKGRLLNGPLPVVSGQLSGLQMNSFIHFLAPGLLQAIDTPESATNW